MKGLIFNIQRYSIHDGGGIRTLVFFKGCPLTCPWCCNPESQSYEPEAIRIIDRCAQCRVCCLDEVECPTGAMTTFGQYYTVEEILKEVEKDILFYESSKGGVTLSGGEVLSQWRFATTLLRELKQLGIHTAIETSGQGPTIGLMQMSPYVDVALFDFKIFSKEKAQSILKADMNLILRNFDYLLNQGIKVIPRIPLIPGYTLDQENLEAIADYLKMKEVKEVHLLPFHQYGSRKYEYLNRHYELSDVKTPTNQKIENAKEIFEAQEFHVVVGGH